MVETVIGPGSKHTVNILELVMDLFNSLSQNFTPYASNFYFLEFEKLLSCVTKFKDDFQAINETVKATEHQTFLQWGYFRLDEKGQKYFIQRVRFGLDGFNNMAKIQKNTNFPKKELLLLLP